MNTTTIYNKLKTSFKQDTGHDVYDDSELGIRMKIIANEMMNVYDEISESERQMFPQTATGIYLERHGESRGVLKKQAQGASGLLKFSSSLNASQKITIPQGTICTSSTGNGVTYETIEDAILNVGSNTVTVSAKATQEGIDTNILANKINTIINQIAGIDSVTNPENFSGGCDVENEEVYRQRVLESFIVYSNGLNLKFFEDIALQNNGVFFAKVLSSTIANNMDLYISDYFRFTSDELVSTVQAQIENERAFNTTITVRKAQAVTVDLSVKIYVKTLGNTVSKAMATNIFLTEKIYDLGIGVPFNPYLLAEGLKEIVEDMIDIDFITPSASVSVAGNKILTPGNIQVTFERRA